MQQKAVQLSNSQRRLWSVSTLMLILMHKLKGTVVQYIHLLLSLGAIASDIATQKQ